MRIEGKMTSEQIIQELERYRSELARIMDRFDSEYHICRDDDPKFRTFVLEIHDLFNDCFGKNQYSPLIIQRFNEGITNYTQSPSFKSIEDIVSIIDSVITRLNRTPDFYIKIEESIKPKTTHDTGNGNNKVERVIDRTDLTLSDIMFSSNYKVKLLVCAVFMAGLGIGISFGASKLYKEKIIPLIDLYKTQDAPEK
jgi:hypothetical protein